MWRLVLSKLGVLCQGKGRELRSKKIKDKRGQTDRGGNLHLSAELSLNYTHQYDGRWAVLLAKSISFSWKHLKWRFEEEGRKERRKMRWHKRITSQLFCIYLFLYDTHAHTHTPVYLFSAGFWLVIRWCSSRFLLKKHQGRVLIRAVTHH